MTTATTYTLDDLREYAHKAEAEAAEAAQTLARRDALALNLYEAGGVTYGDLAEALGKTRDRVSQILADQRKRRARLSA